MFQRQTVNANKREEKRLIIDSRIDFVGPTYTVGALTIPNISVHIPMREKHQILQTDLKMILVIVIAASTIQRAPYGLFRS